MRNLLLGRKEHDFMFFNSRGDPFTHASYRSYVFLFPKILFNEVNHGRFKKSGRKSFFDFARSSNPALRESFATLMKHSVRTQKRFYDVRPLAQKKSKTLDMLSSTVSRSLDKDKEGNIEYLPIRGDFVALVALNSTKKCPKVFTGKVLRLLEDHKTA